LAIALLPPGRLDSQIVTNFPSFFDEFKLKSFNLLWRGGRDGFGVKDFHSRCDNHMNTLMIIQDTEYQIFGGFTPVKLRKASFGSSDWMSDESQEMDGLW
jgi:hypothetical protein